MKTDYKVSYKLYFNENLKEVVLNGILTHPLYIQVTYKRKTTYLKSSYFSSLLDQRYYISLEKNTTFPSLTEIIALEEQLLNSIIEKLGESFTFDSFKKSYDYYSTDLCSSMEDGFKTYFFLYLIDGDLRSLGKAIVEGASPGSFYEVIKDLKVSMNEDLLNGLLNSAIISKQPFIPFFEFIIRIKKNSLKFMPVIEWEGDKIRKLYDKYLQNNFEEGTIIRIYQGMESWLTSLNKMSK